MCVICLTTLTALAGGVQQQHHMLWCLPHVSYTEMCLYPNIQHLCFSLWENTTTMRVIFSHSEKQERWLAEHGRSYMDRSNPG
jgi:hypothetical protein